MIKKIIIGACALISSALLGFFMLYIICALPSGRAAVHVQESGTALRAEGDYWKILPSSNTMQLDNFTDCIMMLTSAYTGKKSALDETIYAYRIYKKGASKQESCQFCGVVPEKQAKEHTYPQYWHGYKVILKPLLTFFNLSELRTMNMYFIMLCISVIILLLNYHKITIFIFPYLIGICFLNIPAVAQSLQYSTIFHLTSIALIVLLLFGNKKKFCEYLWLYFLFIGISTSYMDFLTYPIMTLTFPLVLFFALETKHTISPASACKQLIGYSVSWCIGYAGMWSSKWVISTVLTQKNQFTRAINKILQRSSNYVGDTEFSIQDMITVMKSYLSNNAIKYIVVLFLFITLILALISKGLFSKQGIIITVMFMLIACYPFIWYLFAKNHSYQHNFFTYRSMASFLFSISSIFLPLINWQKIIKSSSSS